MKRLYKVVFLSGSLLLLTGCANQQPKPVNKHKLVNKHIVIDNTVSQKKAIAILIKKVNKLEENSHINSDNKGDLEMMINTTDKEILDYIKNNEK